MYQDLATIKFNFYYSFVFALKLMNSDNGKT